MPTYTQLIRAQPLDASLITLPKSDSNLPSPIQFSLSHSCPLGRAMSSVKLPSEPQGQMHIPVHKASCHLSGVYQCQMGGPEYGGCSTKINLLDACILKGFPYAVIESFQLSAAN